MAMQTRSLPPVSGVAELTNFRLCISHRVRLLCQHEVSHSPCRAYLLLPRVPWECHQQEQGESIP